MMDEEQYRLALQFVMWAENQLWLEAKFEDCWALFVDREGVRLRTLEDVIAAVLDDRWPVDGTKGLDRDVWVASPLPGDDGNDTGAMTCYMCRRKFFPAAGLVREWAGSGRPFDMTDWVCDECGNI